MSHIVFGLGIYWSAVMYRMYSLMQLMVSISDRLNRTSLLADKY